MSSTKRCKMILRSKVAISDELTRINLGAVYSSDPASEDSIYGKYTPYGEVCINVLTSVAEDLVEGQPYYVDIIPAFTATDDTQASN